MLVLLSSGNICDELKVFHIEKDIHQLTFTQPLEREATHLLA